LIPLSLKFLITDIQLQQCYTMLTCCGPTLESSTVESHLTSRSVWAPQC